MTAGRAVRKGEIIGQMLPYRGRYVLEFILREYGGENINPAPFFDLSKMTFDLDFLSRPMSNHTDDFRSRSSWEVVYENDWWIGAR
jgi:hypothetical protein